MRAKIFRGLALVLAMGAVAILAAAWYDEAPDAELHRQWVSRPPVADADNLFMALIGADRVSAEAPHVTGRRIFDNPADDSIARLQFTEDNRDFVGGVRTECRAIPAEESVSCLFRRLPPERIREPEKRMVENYLALRRYPAYRSEIRADGSPLSAGGLLTLHTAYLATRLAVERVDALDVQDLVADTLFLRESMAAVDSLLAHIIGTVVLERNYRLIAEGIEAGNVAQAAALGAALQPWPEKALDLRRDLAYQYASDRVLYSVYRKELSRDEDPMKDYSAMTDLPSPFAEPGLQRRIKALWLKPEMTSKAMLALSRESLGLPDSRKPPGAIDKLLNATAGEIWGPSGPTGSWNDYLSRMSDLDHFVRLIALVGTLAGRKEFDPAQVAAEWNSKLAAQAQSYRLGWDEKQSAFSFDPQSAMWRSRAKTSGHGVLVRVPPYLVQEVDAWRGITARCRGERCELLNKDRAPIAARSKSRLPGNLGPFLAVDEVKPGKYVGISALEQDRQGTWIERRIRVRAANVQ